MKPSPCEMKKITRGLFTHSKKSIGDQAFQSLQQYIQCLSEGKKLDILNLWKTLLLSLKSVGVAIVYIIFW